MTQLPALYFPHPSSINPCAAQVQHAINAWMNKHGYLQTEQAARRFAAGKFAWVTARAHPYAAEADVELVATYMSWLFLVDDLCDEADLGRNPEALRALHMRLIDEMRHPRRTGNTDSVIVGLVDVWAQIIAKGSPQWIARFIHTFEDYARGCQWEAQNRALQIVPSLEDYLHMRRKTSALDIFFDLIELADEIDLPLSVLQNEHIKTLKVMANDGVAWFNDIVSLEKELRTGDVHNLVVVLQHEKKLTLQDAINAAAEMFNARMEAYLALEAERPHFDAAVDSELQRYLDGLRYWVRGNMDWSFETGRYGQAPAKTSPERSAEIS